MILLFLCGAVGFLVGKAYLANCHGCAGPKLAKVLSGLNMFAWLVPGAGVAVSCATGVIAREQSEYSAKLVKIARVGWWLSIAHAMLVIALIFTGVVHV